MFQNRVNDIIYEIAQEENITYKEAKNIIKSHFLFLKIKMSLGHPNKGRDTFKQVRLPGFGNFVVHENKVKKFNEDGKELSEDGTASRDKYVEWERLNKTTGLSTEEKEKLKKLVKIEL